MVNNSPDHIAAIHSKIEIYCVRFCLLLQLLRWACGEGDIDAIDATTVRNSIKLAEYFRATAIRVREIITESPINSMPEIKQRIFTALPDKFKTSEAKTIAQNLGMPPRTLFVFLKDTEFFKKLSHGEYEKKRK